MTAKVYRFPRRIRVQRPESLLQSLAEEADWLSMAADKLLRGYRLDRIERVRLQAAIARLDSMRLQLHG